MRPRDRPRMVRVKANEVETPLIRTIVVDDIDGTVPVPGQFYMLWLPGIDEVPMSVAMIGQEIGFAVQKVGEATAALHDLAKGDMIGVRGPYGRGFSIPGAGDSCVLAVGGGTGVAPVAALVEANTEADLKVVVGARTAEELLYVKRLEAAGAEVVITTDDGTEGRKGFATEAASEILGLGGIDLVVSCGPEIMLRKVVDMCVRADVPVQISLERYMKCGIGICDSCAVNGHLVCRDGPVFSGEEISEAREFGSQRRGPSGRKEHI